ncbi:GntR family transcriptional regulator [Pontibacterium sp.]|uniref:GntR family transcriptional regulator n=1 Tax=Pontibacterium sp. TaxID=2036026 RepID=UPI003569FDD8
MSIIKRRVLYEEVAEILARMIYESRLEPGQWIDEMKLCDELGISRTPLREALKVLASDGLVELVPRKGSYVKSISPEELDELFPIMALLEGYCTQLVAERATASELRRLRHLHDCLEESAAKGDLASYYEENIVFHDELKAVSGNEWLQRITLDLSRVIRLARQQQLKLQGRLLHSLEEHRNIITAIEAGDAAGANQAMQVHLMNQYEALKAAILEDSEHEVD